MKLTEEKIRQIQELTGVTPEQAEQALSAANGDGLEALLWLQQSHIIENAGVGYYSTAVTPTYGTGTHLPVQREPEEHRDELPSTFTGWVQWIWRFLVSNRLEAYRKYDETRKIECPLGALIALLIIAWYVVVGVLMVGIFLGWRYRFAGPQMGGQKINRVVNQIDDWAENARDDVKQHIGKQK